MDFASRPTYKKSSELPPGVFSSVCPPEGLRMWFDGEVDVVREVRDKELTVRTGRAGCGCEVWSYWRRRCGLDLLCWGLFPSSRNVPVQGSDGDGDAEAEGG